MKSEFITAIVVAIVGTLIAFFVCNLFIGEIKPVSVNTISGDISADLVNPDPEIFNYKALNPTVEVFVGNCAEYDESGNCISASTGEEATDTTEQNQGSTTNETNTTDNASSNEPNQKEDS